MKGWALPPMSDAQREGVARFLQQAALAEERCIEFGPCRSHPCARCIYIGNANPPPEPD